MRRKLNCIMLIDDNEDDNFFHARVIKKNDLAKHIVVMSSGQEAIEYLSAKDDHREKPELLFLDINMPGMNGWEFLEAYQDLEARNRNALVIVMLTTSENPDDKIKSLGVNFVCDFQTKPLTKEKLEAIITAHL